MKRLGAMSAALLVLVGAAAAGVPRVQLVVTPTTVPAGGVVRVSAARSPCLAGDQVTLISAAFPGHAFGQGAVYGRAGSHGSFAVSARVRSGLRPGEYQVTVRCGGGNLGVAASFRVVAARSSLAVYLAQDGHVAPVRRFVARTAAPARAALAALLRGPTVAERREGYTSDVPGSTALRSVSLAQGVLTVDLSRRFETGGGSQSTRLRVAQVVYTASQFTSVSRVAFRLDGKAVTTIGGVSVGSPVDRSSFEAQAPAILVEQPLPGDHVSTPLRISGTADVFEARFSVDVVTAGGKLLVHRAVEASSGSGVRGTFSLAIPFTTTARHLVVVAYELSPKNGARIHLVRIPITAG
jgi:germination protein M